MEKRRKFIHILIIAAVLFLTFEAAGYYFGANNVASSDATKTRVTKNNKIKFQALKGKNAALRQKLRSLTPQEVYIVVDTGRNRLYLKRGDRIIREAVISCGSGVRSAHSRIEATDSRGHRMQTAGTNVLAGIRT